MGLSYCHTSVLYWFKLKPEGWIEIHSTIAFCYIVRQLNWVVHEKFYLTFQIRERALRSACTVVSSVTNVVYKRMATQSQTVYSLITPICLFCSKEKDNYILRNVLGLSTSYSKQAWYFPKDWQMIGHLSWFRWRRKLTHYGCVGRSPLTLHLNHKTFWDLSLLSV